MTDSLIREFVREQRELLELELNSEQDEAKVAATGTKDEDSSHRTVALRQLEASDISAGLYGRTVVQLTVLPKDGKKQDGSITLLPAHRFTVGDDVEIHSKQHDKNRKNIPGGVVCAVTDTSISVALFQKNNGASGSKKDDKNNKQDNNNDSEEDALLGSPPLTLIPKSSVEVHRKLVAGLAELERHGPNHPIAGHLVEALFLPPSRPLPSISSSQSIEPFNDNLDTSQLEAIAFALEQDRPVSLIHGPPGTGKTTTVAELIQQAVYNHGMKVLVAAPSNVAVDNVLERLAASSPSAKKTRGAGPKKTKQLPLKMVRLGHPARIKPSILRYSLEALVQSHDGTEIVQDVRSELTSFLRILTNSKSRGNDKRMAYREVKSLRKEVRMREEKVVQELLSSAQVVLATTVGAASRLLNTFTDVKSNAAATGFDLVVIDEAAQALEASCWIPILKGRKLVLAGDHCQLPPTIMCTNSKVQTALGKTLFERLMELYGDKLRAGSETEPRVSRMLKVQYRMHEEIANWASKASYHGELLTHDSVRHRTIRQLLRNQTDDELETSDDDVLDVVSEVALLLVDTAGCGMHESENASGSRFNEGEAQLVAKHVHTLLNMGMRQEQIAIITPYNGQVELLRGLLLPDNPKLEIRSVDGFQGGEREAVVLSLVRSSERGGGKKGDGIGFLRDNRRLNVAVTRAKRHCAVICDTETVIQSKFVKCLITWMEEHGEQRSAMEFLTGSGNDINNDLRDAEIELQKAMAELAKSEAKKQAPKKGTENHTDDEGRRKALLDKISRFSETGKQGEEMTLSSELTSFDRRVVHEFAEQLGLGHRSEGVDGKDRRIFLRIENVAPPPPNVEAAKPKKEHKIQESTDNDAASIEPMPAPSTFFAALAVDDEESESEAGGGEVENAAEEPVKTSEVESPPSNNLLKDLARERELRAKQHQQQSQQPATANKTKKKKSKKGQKLGGKKPADEPKDTNEGLEDLDDMAFLDKQIENVQTSHGRKVEGSGSNYRTMINGILISKPAPREKEKNTRASSALQAKIKKAQGDRKAKPKKK
jgi:ATP-dependent RNA/DNA helicase IGHMBP2